MHNDIDTFELSKDELDNVECEISGEVEFSAAFSRSFGLIVFKERSVKITALQLPTTSSSSPSAQPQPLPSLVFSGISTSASQGCDTQLAKLNLQDDLEPEAKTKIVKEQEQEHYLREKLAILRQHILGGTKCLRDMTVRAKGGWSVEDFERVFELLASKVKEDVCVCLTARGNLELLRDGNYCLHPTSITFVPNANQPEPILFTAVYYNYIPSDGEEDVQQQLQTSAAVYNKVDDSNNSDNILPRKRSRNHRGNASRAVILAQFLVDHFGTEYLQSGSGVVDVAGGSGELSFELCYMRGLKCTTIDPRLPKLTTKQHRQIDSRKGWRERLKAAPTCSPLCAQLLTEWLQQTTPRYIRAYVHGHDDKKGPRINEQGGFDERKFIQMFDDAEDASSSKSTSSTTTTTTTTTTITIPTTTTINTPTKAKSKSKANGNGNSNTPDDTSTTTAATANNNDTATAATTMANTRSNSNNTTNNTTTTNNNNNNNNNDLDHNHDGDDDALDTAIMIMKNASVIVGMHPDQATGAILCAWCYVTYLIFALFLF